MRQLGFTVQAEASVEVLTSDVVRSAAIEREHLERRADHPLIGLPDAMAAGVAGTVCPGCSISRSHSRDHGRRPLSPAGRGALVSSISFQEKSPWIAITRPGVSAFHQVELGYPRLSQLPHGRAGRRRDRRRPACRPGPARRRRTASSSRDSRGRRHCRPACPRSVRRCRRPDRGTEGAGPVAIPQIVATSAWGRPSMTAGVTLQRGQRPQADEHPAGHHGGPRVSGAAGAAQETCVRKMSWFSRMAAATSAGIVPSSSRHQPVNPRAVQDLSFANSAGHG